MAAAGAGAGAGAGAARGEGSARCHRLDSYPGCSRLGASAPPTLGPLLQLVREGRVGGSHRHSVVLGHGCCCAWLWQRVSSGGAKSPPPEVLRMPGTVLARSSRKLARYTCCPVRCTPVPEEVLPPHVVWATGDQRGIQRAFLRLGRSCISRWRHGTRAGHNILLHVVGSWLAQTASKASRLANASAQRYPFFSDGAGALECWLGVLCCSQP